MVHGKIRDTLRGLMTVALVGLGAGAVFCQGTAPMTLKILVPQSTSALPFLQLAKDQPIAKTEIRVETFASHPQALALLLRGEADMLLTGTSQGWENRLDGSPIVMVDTGIWGVSSLIGRDAGIKGFTDLRGKRIALPFSGSPLDFQFRTLLAKHGLSAEADVSLSYGAFTQSIPRLMAGQLDAVALPEPQATTMVKANGLLRLFRFADEWALSFGGDGKTPQVSLFVTETFAHNRGGLVVALVDEWRKSSAAASADPAGFAAGHAAALSTNAALLEEAMKNTLYGVPSLSQNKSLVLDYFRTVSPYFPQSKGSLDEAFFFQP